MRTNFSMANQNLTMVKGDTLSFNVKVTNHYDASIEAEQAFLTCKRSPSDEEIVFRKTIEDGITFENGLYTVRVAPEDTANADIGQYYYDMEIRVGADVYTILRGTLIIEQDIS